jgi:hypothetical protein
VLREVGLQGLDGPLGLKFPGEREHRVEEDDDHDRDRYGHDARQPGQARRGPQQQR